VKQNFNESLRRLLKHEGGYTNHPSDPGGATNFGITIHDYRKYINPQGTASDVRAMNVEEAKSIYRAKYWDVQRCDDLPSGVDYAIFDYGVNSGVGRSGKVLRRILGMPDNTHVITNAVVTAARKRDASELVRAICDERLAFLKRLKTWDTFGKGWGRRVAEVKSYSLKLTGQPATEPKPPKPASQSKTIWASILAGLATIAETFVNVLGDYRVWIAIIVLALLAYIIWERNGKPDIKGLFR
jgi:lysozyme family protein